MTHRSRLSAFIIDCQTDDPRPAAAFWAAALASATTDEDEKYVGLESQGGLNCAVQAVDHPPRVHLDIESDDIPAEVARLERLGAKKLAAVKTWVVMEAPTGHRFCVIRAQSADFERAAKTWDDPAP